MEVGQEDAHNVVPGDTDLGEALQRASASVEQQALTASLDQSTGPESVHHRARASGAEQCDLDLLGRQRHREAQESENHSGKDGDSKW